MQTRWLRLAPFILLSACATGGLPQVIDPLDVKAQSGAPVITRIRDAGTALVPRSGPIDGISDGVAGPGELLVIEGHGFGRQPTVIVGGRGAETLARVSGGGVVVRVPRGVPAGLVDVTVTTSGGVARLATELRRLALALHHDQVRFVAVGKEGLALVPGGVQVPGARAVRVDGTGAVGFVLADDGATSKVSVVDLGRMQPQLLGGLSITHRGVALAVAGLAPRLAVVGAGKLSLVDTTSVRRPVLYDAAVLPKDVHDVSAAELSPDGRVLALLHADGNRLTALDVGNPTAPVLMGTVDVLPGERQRLVRALAFSPDGQTLWVVSGPSAETHPQVLPTRITALRLLAACADGSAVDETRAAPPTGPVRRMIAVWRTQTIDNTGVPLALVVGNAPDAQGSAIRSAPELATVLVTACKEALLDLKSGPVDPARVEKLMGAAPGMVSRAELGSGSGPIQTSRDLLAAFAATPEGGRIVALALRAAEGRLEVGVESVVLERDARLQFAPLGPADVATAQPPFALGGLALQP